VLMDEMSIPLRFSKSAVFGTHMPESQQALRRNSFGEIGRKAFWLSVQRLGTFGSNGDSA
jgi:hypothetical protein